MDTTETLQVTQQTIHDVPMSISIGIVVIVVVIIAMVIIRKKKK